MLDRVASLSAKFFFYFFLGGDGCQRGGGGCNVTIRNSISIPMLVCSLGESNPNDSSRMNQRIYSIKRRVAY